MSFLKFINIFKNNSLIDARNIVIYFNGLDRRRLYEWQKKGYLLKIINNFYVIANRPVNDQLLKNIASQIYQPSYVGLESALSYYNFIPEAVFQIVNITTRRNKMVQTKIGNFHYHSIKASLFFGYDIVEIGDNHFFISDPEKTLLDFLYFSSSSDKKEVLDEMRLNKEEIRQTINHAKISNYLKLFSSPKLNKAVQNLMEAVNVEF